MQGQFVEQVALQYESEPQYVEQYVVATNEHEAKVMFHSFAPFPKSIQKMMVNKSASLIVFLRLP